MFSYKFCEISKNTFFTEHLRAATSVRFKKILCTLSRSSLVQTCHYYLLYYFEVKKQKQSFANKISTYNAIKKRLQHRCFPGKFANFSPLQHNFGGCFCTNPDLCGSMYGEVMLWSFTRSLS